MAGFVARRAPVAATFETLTVIPNDMTVNIRCVNRDLANPISVHLAISPAETAPAAPGIADYIEAPDVFIPAGGVLENTAIAVNAGEVITIRCSSDKSTWRLHGR